MTVFDFGCGVQTFFAKTVRGLFPARSLNQLSIAALDLAATWGGKMGEWKCENSSFDDTYALHGKIVHTHQPEVFLWQLFFLSTASILKCIQFCFPRYNIVEKLGHLAKECDNLVIHNWYPFFQELVHL